MLNRHCAYAIGLSHDVYPYVKFKYMFQFLTPLSFHFISFHLFADNIAIYKADTVILGCRSPQGNNLLRGAYRKNEVKK